MLNIFCKECGRILSLKKEVMFCVCGEPKPEMNEISFKEKIKTSEFGNGSVDDENVFATFPHICKKCGYDKAEIIDLGIWYSDEAGVIRYKCGKCKYVEQDNQSNT
jgi:DNA-directed RNA polymerase subunit M/transcription elongation factor TFIIS